MTPDNKADFTYEGYINRQVSRENRPTSEQSSNSENPGQYTSIDKKNRLKRENCVELEENGNIECVEKEITVVKYPQIEVPEESLTYISVERPKQATVTIMDPVQTTLPKTRKLDYTEVVINADADPVESAKMATERAQFLFSEYAEINVSNDGRQETVL